MVVFFRKPIVIVVIILVVVILAGALIFVKRGGGPDYEFIIAQKGDVIEEVNVTGRVEPTESVNLAFEIGGRVSAVHVQIGDRVERNTRLVNLDSGELTAQLLKAGADLEVERAELDDLQKGTRIEEIEAAETEVSNAERSLQDSELNLVNVKNKAQVDLQNSYDNGLTTSQKAVLAGKNAILTLTDIQFARFLNTDQESLDLVDIKAIAVLVLLGAENAGGWSINSLGRAEEGAFGVVQDAVAASTYENIDKALADSLEALQKVKNALEAVPLKAEFTVAEKANLASEKNIVATEIANLSGIQQGIVVQIATNSENVSNAQAGVNSAKNVLASAEDSLKLKKAGAEAEKITAQEARVKSAQANVQNIREQLTKTILISPLGGIVTQQDAKVGEIIASNTILVSLISDAMFEIKANIAEVDITKVNIGDLAEITLDAYGDEVVFGAEVIMIDPAETIIEGVATYEVTLEFRKEDSRIRSGMTSNIVIETKRKEDVIRIPQRAVLTVNQQKVVRILKGKDAVETVQVQTGIRGSDGNIEIVSGIAEGDKIVTFVRE